MMPDRAELLRLVRMRVAHLVAINVVEESMELYYDLRISGWDLDSLVGWAENEFKTDFSRFDVNAYGPGEGAELVRPIAHMIGLRPYKSVTVGDLLDAIQRGRW